MSTKSRRSISSVKEKSLESFLLRREFLLILLFIAVNVMNASISRNYLNATNLFTAISTFLVRGFIALPMAYILMMGDIDLSVGSQVALSASLLGVAFNSGLPMEVAVIIALVCGTLCGFINGVIVTRFTELAPMIVTLGTMTLYRGITEMILESQSTGGFHKVEWFYNLYYGRIGSVPYIFLIFILLAVIFGFVLHKTVFGRHLYAIGSSRQVAEYSGIPVQRGRLISFTLLGLVCGISAIYYSAWMGTVRSDIATGYELEAISMVVLGGISTATNQNAWIDAMKEILKGDAYKDLNLVEVAYGDDEQQKSVDQTKALLQNYPNLKVICAPTTVGIAAASKVVSDDGLQGKVIVTGLGLPSEMADFMTGDNPACPYMFLWNPIDVGRVAAYTLMEMNSGSLTGTLGQTYKAANGVSYEVTDAGDGGTEIIIGPPFEFNGANIEDWKTVY